MNAPLTTGALTPANAFSRPRLWQAWLSVEAALAEAQAEIGMIPDWAAREIADKANLEHLDLAVLEASSARVMAPIAALVRHLSEATGEAGGYVHWGATTQNVMQTGRVLLVRDVQREIRRGLGRILTLLSDWAETHAATVTAGRTNNRHALPITFGFKAAGWIAELSRQIERFDAAEAQLYQLHFGGAIGAMHAYGSDGPALCEALARRLGLSAALVPDRVSLDGLAGYVLSMGLFASGAGRIASELYDLMRDEISEVSEDLGHHVVGSSTMPHKVNPKYVVDVLACGARVRALAAPAMEAAMPQHEGDAACNQLMANTLDSAASLGWELVIRLEKCLGKILIHPEAMARNLSLSAEVIATENLMMILAPRIGRTQAHDLVHEAIAKYLSGQGCLRDLLLSDARISAVISPADLGAALDPSNYLGESASIARQAAASGRQIAARLL